MQLARTSSRNTLSIASSISYFWLNQAVSSSFSRETRGLFLPGDPNFTPPVTLKSRAAGISGARVCCGRLGGRGRGMRPMILIILGEALRARLHECAGAFRAVAPQRTRKAEQSVLDAAHQARMRPS